MKDVSVCGLCCSAIVEGRKTLSSACEGNCQLWFHYSNSCTPFMVPALPANVVVLPRSLS